MRLRNRARILEASELEENIFVEKKKSFSKPAYPVKIMKELRQLLVDERDRMIYELRALENRVYDADNTEHKPGFSNQLVDTASDDIEQDIALKMRSLEAQRYTMIIQALKAMETNEYGYCLGTGQPIELERLRFEPWAKYSMAYLRQQEAKKK